MPARFVSVDRDTPMLLPPDLREWVTEDDLAHFVIEAVDRLPLESFRVNHRGTGAKQFPPHMMLALLIYSYANGLFSSRKIERATHRDVAIRYLTAGTHPDHDTICKTARNLLLLLGICFWREGFEGAFGPERTGEKGGCSPSGVFIKRN
ncbi:transposase [Akkermansiaceae bacterium]|nr:transposase [Akkermansiaceae bacterium]MDB4463058.1 transposase [Akkermansiaceae bacterium]